MIYFLKHIPIRLVFFLFVFCFVIAFNCDAQQISQADLKQLASEFISLKEIDRQISSCTMTLNRKVELANLLQKKIKVAHANQNKSLESLLIYELFITDIRKRNEELKLWQLKSIQAFQSKLNSPQRDEIISNYLKELLSKRGTILNDTLSESSNLISSVSDLRILKRFESLTSAFKANYKITN